MLLPFYPHARSHRATMQDLTKTELLKILANSIETSIKDNLAWSPAVLAPCSCPCRNTGRKRVSICEGGEYHRLNENTLRHELIVFDLDHVTSELAGDTLAKLEDAGLEYVCYSTFSHDQAKADATPEPGCAPANTCSLRLVLFPDKPVPAADVPAVRNALVDALEIPVDPRTKDLSRLYYLPAHQTGREPFFIHHQGDTFGVQDALAANAAAKAATNPAAAPALAAAQTPPAATTPADLTTLREALQHAKRATTSAEAKTIIGRVLDGEPLAPEGEHDATLQQLAGLAATWLPDGTPTEAVVTLCEVSLRRMEWQDGWEHLLETFEEKHERAVERTKTYRAEKKAAHEVFLAEYRKKLAATVQDPQVAESTEDGHYTNEALDEWKIGDEEWVIQYRQSFFVFANGRYVQRSKDEVLNSYQRDLARAPIQTEVETKSGPRSITFPEVMRTYGTVAERLESSLVLQRSYYDPVTHTFHEAVCPRRPLQAKEHPEIQRWLELAAAEPAQCSKLLDWIACVPRLDRQLCALYLYGPKGAGKTLLPQGLSRLWTTGAPADLGLALGGFNEVLVNCPLVFADETLPNVRNIDAKLREFIGTSVRPLTRKFLAPSSLHGAVRLVLSGNNLDLLRPSGDLTEYDLEAVSERFLPITLSVAAAEYLLELGGVPVVDKWIRNDMIAEHALWLAETRVVAGGNSRFLVAGEKGRFHERLAVNSGAGSGVCESLVKHLSNIGKRQLAPGLKDLILVGEGHLLVNASILEPLWLDYVKSTDLPTIQRASRALAAIGDGSWVCRVSGIQRRYTHVRLEQLIAWADEAGIAEADALRATADAPNDALRKLLDIRQAGVTLSA